MKYIIASDLHGSAEYVSKLMDAWDREGAGLLLLLGDVLYHGPRNDLPDGYDTKRAAALLNARYRDILAVRGNCDAEVDQMVLDFPITADSMNWIADGRRLFLTHGHIYSPSQTPVMAPGDVMLSGHTHVPACVRSPEGVWFLNPGSVSIPKGGSPHSYMTLEGDVFLWKTLEGGVYRTLDLSAGNPSQYM